MVTDVIRFAGLALAIGWSPLLLAADLGDPTRPPAVAADARPGDTQGPVAPVLESVMLPAHGKPVAIINGKTVALGEYFGEDRLVRLTETEAVLRGKGGLTRLALNPSISVKPSVKANAGSTAGKMPRGRP